jgi:hypothetical protein
MARKRSWEPGHRVIHPKFGAGVITRLSFEEEEEEEDYLEYLWVRFDGHPHEEKPLGPRGVKRENAVIPSPQCCEKMRTHPTVRLNVMDLDANLLPNPSWVGPATTIEDRFGAAIEVEEKMNFCPYCGTTLPEVEPIEPPEPYCRITDGGYYCDTCRQRLPCCYCNPPVTAWRTREGKKDRKKKGKKT